MHLLRKVVRKSVRKVTPRPVRQVNRVVRHPVLTTYQTVAPRPIQRAERSVYNVTHPVNAIENKAVNTIIGPPVRWSDLAGGAAGLAGAGAFAPAAAALTAPKGRSAPRPRPPAASPTGTRPNIHRDDDHYDAVRRLADRADPSTRPQLLTALEHPDPIIRKIAVRGIGRLHDPADDAVIAEALVDRSDDVRVEAARVAHDRPSVGLRTALLAAANDSEPLVRRLAAEALARLDGSRVSASAEAKEPQPATHAVEESDPPDLRLALLVGAHNGSVTMTVRELLVWLDRKILTGAALGEIDRVFAEAGLRCHPKVDDLNINGKVTLIRHEGIPEFEIRGHVDALGPWTMSVRDILRAFDRHKLTLRARTEIAEALQYADLTAVPPLASVGSDDQLTIQRAE
jgi:hypothetical protein